RVEGCLPGLLMLLQRVRCKLAFQVTDLGLVLEELVLEVEPAGDVFRDFQALLDQRVCLFQRRDLPLDVAQAAAQQDAGYRVIEKRIALRRQQTSSSGG